MTESTGSSHSLPLIFDGHNDVLSRLWEKDTTSPHIDFLNGDGLGHLDLPRMRSGGFAGGLFAIYVPSHADEGLPFDAMNSENGYDLPLPPMLDSASALEISLQQAGLLLKIEKASMGAARLCLSAGEIRQCIDDSALAMVMHMEGAEAIDTDFNNLEVLYHAGLRSIGPVWSRPTVFGHGVPFRFPGSPDTGDGLTDAGKALIRAMNELQIVIDLSHLNEKGFWDVAAISDSPLIASHSNAHVLSASTRNLTDRQLLAIRESDGLVGVNFATCFIRADGRMRADTSLDDLLRHVDYLIEMLGEDRVGFGSDFDGAVVPDAIGDVTGLNTLRSAMSAHGYDSALLEKLCQQNWIAALERVFGR
ncbi:MAG: dipeptidase [Granulosicoccus sp.]|nr:dipeptidase [Granulosicoccus sp.]